MNNAVRETVHAFLSDVHAAAAKACEGLDNPGLLQLVRIHPATGRIGVARFKIGDVDAMTDLAIADAEGGHNSYVEARTVRNDAAKRGASDETVAVFALVIDRDADKGVAGVQFVEPTMRVETSPGNAHDWLALNKALSYEDAEKLGAAIRKAVGADTDSGVPTQPYRVAGTPNFPNASKRQRGRTVCGTHYQNGGPTWNFDELLKAVGGELIVDDAPQASPVDTAPTGEIDAIVEKLVAEALPKGKRSTRFANAVKLAVERGMTAADFEALCRANPQGCAQKYLPPERRDVLGKRIAEIWKPRAVEVAAHDAFGAGLVKQLLENFPARRDATETTEGGIKTRLLQSSAEFVEGFKPPDYLIDGLLQRRYIYSMTAPTGTGKTCIALRIAAHVSLGIELAGREVEKGSALYFAGENPDDVRTRWIKQCEDLGQSPDKMDVVFLPGTPPISNKDIRKRIDTEAADHGPFSLVIIDTSAAYFLGDDENSNAQLAAHARMLRSFVNLPGGPTILVTCHPIKSFDPSNLLPRGGGAFLNEVDGNLVCLKEPGSSVVTLDTHGKFRGPDFAPFSFKLVSGTSEKLKDTKGRHVETITAEPITQEDKSALEDIGRDRQNDLLVGMKTNSGLSLSELADKLGWFYKNGGPNTSLVHRLMGKLAKDKLVVKKRDHYELTKKGTEAADDIAAAPPSPALGWLNTLGKKPDKVGGI